VLSVLACRGCTANHSPVSLTMKAAASDCAVIKSLRLCNLCRQFKPGKRLYTARYFAMTAVNYFCQCPCGYGPYVKSTYIHATLNSSMAADAMLGQFRSLGARETEASYPASSPQSLQPLRQGTTAPHRLHTVNRLTSAVKTLPKVLGFSRKRLCITAEGSRFRLLQCSPS
jgi:hypothetical protein